MIIVIDSGVLLKAYFSDEDGHTEAQNLISDYAKGNITFHAPSLITYEIINACLVASRMARFPKKRAKELMNEMLGIEIIKEDIGPLKDRIFDISTKHSTSAYDGAYIAVAESRHIPFLTADKKLLNSLKHHFSFVKWIGNYSQSL
ncbi:MAG TPA: PIN domain-containing protein [Nitrospirae bacterium]|nr:PIN domain protein [bacterium BMS3Abin10]GBE39280.1 PIN domain protein [bacterium BMS3Bbin08]HDH51016.1 PIN domain-containing protein [Nitrospirota bacterium]HDK16583.1 PIN domain-containing protein [Nitrospirota bacterium]HDK82392.1 PIN domain-containing protein [Nitrospirota bacterium]